MPCWQSQNHHLGTLVAGEVVPHEQHAQRRKLRGQSEAFCQPVLPNLPRGPCGGRIDRIIQHWERRQDQGQRLLEPAMQDRVRASGHRLHVHLTGRRMEQGQELARAAPDIFVRLGGGAAVRLPGAAGMRHRLEGPGLIFAPNRQTA